MRDWVGFNKDAGTDVMAKVGQWNEAVALRALVEVAQDHLNLLKKRIEAPPVHAGRTYELLLKGGTKLAGEIQACGPTWVEISDNNGNAIIVQVSEIACFLEKSRPAEREAGPDGLG